jgi:pyruvate dehydrogenase (quinone)
VDSPEQIEGAWEEALSADRPVLYEAVVDPEVPPLPPHIAFERAEAMTRAIYRGDPNAAEIIRHAFADLADNFITHH